MLFEMYKRFLNLRISLINFLQIFFRPNFCLLDLQKNNTASIDRHNLMKINVERKKVLQFCKKYNKSSRI